MGVSAIETMFRPFSELPPELREEIWRYCLPYRFRELDMPLADNVYWDQPQPCKLQDTSWKNSRPPLIYNACHEARAVACRAGSVQKPVYDLADADWYSATLIKEVWHDPLRHALEYLALAGQNVPGNVSFTDEYLEQNSLGRARDMEFLQRRTSWLVVVYTIVVHSDIRHAAASGLFGLACDSRVRIVDVDDIDRASSFLHFAAACEEGRDVTVAQDFRMESLQSASKRLGKSVRSLKREDVAKRIRPAVMFRLCTQWCNDRAVRTACKRVGREPVNRGRGGIDRGRGRVMR